MPWEAGSWSPPDAWGESVWLPPEETDGLKASLDRAVADFAKDVETCLRSAHRPCRRLGQARLEGQGQVQEQEGRQEGRQEGLCEGQGLEARRQGPDRRHTERSQCRVCLQYGHWGGDLQCPGPAARGANVVADGAIYGDDDDNDIGSIGEVAVAESVFEAALDTASSVSGSTSSSPSYLQRLRSLLDRHQTRRTICRLREVLTVSAAKRDQPIETVSPTALPGDSGKLAEVAEIHLSRKNRGLGIPDSVCRVAVSGDKWWFDY